MREVPATYTQSDNSERASNGLTANSGQQGKEVEKSPKPSPNTYIHTHAYAHTQEELKTQLSGPISGRKTALRRLRNYEIVTRFQKRRSHWEVFGVRLWLAGKVCVCSDLKAYHITETSGTEQATYEVPAMLTIIINIYMTQLVNGSNLQGLKAFQSP